MTTERKSGFVVYTNEEQLNREREFTTNTNNRSSAYHSNPMYEKLLKYKQLQEKKKFTVDDLLKWC